MAEEFAQFQEGQPLIKESEVRTKATGFEKMGAVLGVAAKELFSKSENMAQEASSTNYLQSQAMLSELNSSAKMQILENPNMGPMIAEKTKENAEIIKESAFLNSSDRSKFDSMADDTMRSLAFDGKKSQLGVIQEQAKFETLNNFQRNLEAYSKSMFSLDPKAAIEQQNAMLESIRGQVSQGILTAHEGAHMHNMMSNEIRRHDEIVSAIKQGNATASTFHAIKAFSSDSTTDNARLPTNENSRQIYDLNSEYSSIEDVKAAYAQGHTVNPAIFYSIKSPHAIIKLNNYKEGAHIADGMIYSADSFPNIQNKIKELKSIHERNGSQQGMLDRLNNIVSDFENGDGLKYVSNVQTGAQAQEKYLTQKSAIESSKNSDEVKSKALTEIHNEFLTSINQTYESMKIPQQYRTLFPSSHVNSVKRSLFDPDGKVVEGLNYIWKTKKDALPYLANQMGNPAQAMTVMTLGLLKGKADSAFLTNLAITQKQGIDYNNSLIQIKTDSNKNPITDGRIKSDLMTTSGLDGFRKINEHSPSVKGETPISATVEMGMNYIKGRAVQMRDPEIKKYKEYMEEFTSNISRGYAPIVGNNFTIDSNVIPVSESQAEMISNHAIRDVYRKKLKEGYTKQQLEIEYVNNPYKVISSPTGHLTVVNLRGNVLLDPSGQPYYDHLYLGTTLSAAREDVDNPIFTASGKREHNSELSRRY